MPNVSDFIMIHAHVKYFLFKKHVLFLLLLAAATACRKKNEISWGSEFVPPDQDRIDSLICDSVQHRGTLLSLFNPSDSVWFFLPFRSSTAVYQQALRFPSSGVGGLFAESRAQNFPSGYGSLNFQISGLPQSSGSACFDVNINQKNCRICLQVKERPETGITDHLCGVSRVHRTDRVYGRMQDQEGTVYRTVRIGNQEWMAENLRTSHFRNGDPIPLVNTDAAWKVLKTPACSWNYNDPNMECPYGKVYNFYAVRDPRRLCPAGWHVPSDTAWQELIDFAGGEENAGLKLRSAGNYYWKSSGSVATNEFGFSGLGGGRRFDSGPGFFLKEYGCWWASNTHIKNSSLRAWMFLLSYNVNYAALFPTVLNFGQSVRCLKD